MFGAYGYKNTLVGNLASQIAKQKAKQTKKIMGDAGKDLKKRVRSGVILMKVS